MNMNPVSSNSSLHQENEESDWDETLHRSQTSAPDLGVHRSISDSMLARGRLQTMKYGDQDTTCMLVHRSGGAAVKRMMATIREASIAQESACAQLVAPPSGTTTVPTTAAPTVAPPEKELCILAQWAADSYYRVLISRNQGISSILRVMKAFPLNSGLQECCCLLLGYLCLDDDTVLVVFDNEGGIHRILAAMENHGKSVAVQSAACEALVSMQRLLLKSASINCAQVFPDLMAALYRASQMSLHPKHRRNLLSLIQHCNEKSLKLQTR